MVKILVGAPTISHTNQLLAPARQLVDEVGEGKVLALALGPAAGQAESFIHHGADTVLRCKDELLSPLHVEVRSQLLLNVIEKYKPDIVLIGDTVRSRDVASFVSAKLGVGCGSQWTSLRLEDGRLVGERSFYSGRSVVREKLTRDPQIATVMERAFEPNQETSRTGDVVDITVGLDEPKAKLVSVEKEAAEGTNLEEAKVVVSAGRGIKAKEDLAMVEELAEAMGGSVGCTRPIAADLKWLGDEHWIGLSGHKVKPQAYVGLGVSGQIQHVTGMRGSKLIVAINTDEEAPLVQISDYAIIDDLYKVVPALIQEIKSLKGQ